MEGDASGADATIHADATVALDDGMEADVDGFDTAVSPQGWSPGGGRRASRDASNGVVLERLTRQAVDAATGGHQ